MNQLSLLRARWSGRSTRLGVLALGLLGVSGLLLVLAFSVGSTGFDSVLQAHQDPVARQIVWDIRVPRALGAWLAGALLGLAGAVAQGLFRNPLADPYLLGSASGASLGVGLGLLWLGVLEAKGLWQFQLGLTGAAFAGAVGAVVLTLLLARGTTHTLRLLLAGVVVGVVLGALGQLIMLVRPEVMLVMQSFLLGGTGFVSWDACVLMAIVLLLCGLTATALSTVLDALSLGEATAASLGLPLASVRAALVLVMALATGTAVAHTGLIGFVGLAAPHLVRSLAPAPYRYFTGLSCLMGAVLLLSADTLARSLLAPQELPVGVVTAVLGGGYLLWLMHRGSRRGGWL